MPWRPRWSSRGSGRRRCIPDVRGGRDDERAADGGRTDVGLARGVDRGATARDSDLRRRVEVGAVDVGRDGGAPVGRCW